MSGDEPRASRRLYEARFRSGERNAVNLRDAVVRADGSVALEGYDLDPDLERFVGRDEWEGEVVVAAKDVPRLLAGLRADFGSPARALCADHEILALLAKGFGGDIRCITRFEEWCAARGIALTHGSW